ncbi:HEAT repeat domain-containing protein [Cellulomonas sp. 179-A 4D5 NHS]|uniref:HEAT repeat domain-containing protein n=1 Tax=Cellulomonas sp. 179-A 4D5 NHS TaxID=3142378 RepID=UPI0039A39085
MDSLSDLPLATLVAAALEEARHGTSDAPPLHLLELHRRATDDVLDLALRSTASTDPDERDLGISILRELGPADAARRRPFSDRVVPRLLALLHATSDPATERSLLQALAFNGARESLEEFLRRVDHPDDGVRVTVAFQLPGLTDPDRPSAAVLDALEHLTHDADADVRFYALYALVAEDGFGVDPARALRAARHLVDDPDGVVRDLARAHSAERIATPLGPLALRLTCGGVPLGVPSASSVLPSGARTARWDDVGGLTIDVLVVPYSYDSVLLEHPRCTCWGIEWRLHARIDTGTIRVHAQLSDGMEGVRGGGWHLAATLFADPDHALAVGGPAHDAFDDELVAGLQAPSWRGSFSGQTPPSYGAEANLRGLGWLLPGLRAGESAATHVAVAWTRLGPEKADDATECAVDITRASLRRDAGVEAPGAASHESTSAS